MKLKYLSRGALLALLFGASSGWSQSVPEPISGPEYPEMAVNCALAEFWDIPETATFNDFIRDYSWRQAPWMRMPAFAESIIADAPFPLALRLRGYVTIPVSGDYRFDLSGTGVSALMVGADGTPFSKITAASQITGVPATGEPFAFEAGQKIYVEIIQIQGEAGLNLLDWGWIRPDGVRETIPAELWESFTLRNDDADDNGLSDDFENLSGIAVPTWGASNPSLYGWAGDFDGDGWTNLEEYQIVSNPDRPPAFVVPSTPITTLAYSGAVPSLSNGEFTPDSSGSWVNAQHLHDFKGGGFDWKYTSMEGWSAYKGSSVEVWSAGGDTFVELDASAGNYGVKQSIKDVRAGAYLLRWKHLDRRDPNAGNNAYTVKIFYVADGSNPEVPLGTKVTLAARNDLVPTPNATSWEEQSFAFNLTAKDIAVAGTEGVFVAFVPKDENNNTYGTLIDAVKISHAHLDQVGFSGTRYRELRSDDLSVTYSGGHWFDANGDGLAATGLENANGDHNYPVAFTRKSTPFLAATLSGVNLGGVSVSVRAKRQDGDELYIPETLVSTTPSSAPGTYQISLPYTPATVPLPDQIDFFNADGNAFELNWEVKLGGGDWQPLVTSKHTVYVTLGDPIKTAKGLPLETLVNIGCRNAKGMRDGSLELKNNIVDAIYNEFKSRRIYKVIPSTCVLDLGHPSLGYWRDSAGGIADTAGLLRTCDGQCGAWSKFYIDVLRVQGIDADEMGIVPVPPSDDELKKHAIAVFGPSIDPLAVEAVTGFYVKKWDLTNWLNPKDLFGAEGQGVDNPSSNFVDHAVVKFNGKIYDPSYGSPVANNLIEWEAYSIDGVGVEIRYIGAIPAVITPEYIQTVWRVKPSPAGLLKFSNIKSTY